MTVLVGRGVGKAERVAQCHLMSGGLIQLPSQTLSTTRCGKDDTLAVDDVAIKWLETTK